uniref:Uncharacterized protein n=1 Tax=viral metagenome TaxID=1070528 RepID=A0A6H1ZRF8_9ZZZZ
MRYVKHEAWQEFEDKFPDAAVFLRHHDLIGELTKLRSHFGILTEWEKQRLAELEKLGHLK